MTYSLDFRKKVLSIKECEGLSLAEASKRFGIGMASITRWSHRLQAKTKRNKPATKIDMEQLKKDIEEHPDAYLDERAKRLCVSRSCVWLAMKRLTITYKKKPLPSGLRR